MLVYSRIAFVPVLLPLLFSALVSICPAQDDTPETLYQQARAAEAAGDLKTAARNYERIVSLRPDLAEAHANLGRLYYQQQQLELASRSLKRAVELKPELAGPHFFLGVMAFNSRNYGEALKYLKTAQKLNPTESVTTLYLGYTNYAVHNYLEAVQDFQKVVQVQQNDENALYYLSTSYGQAAKYYYQILQQSFPDSLYTHLVRAHAFEALSDWHGAESEYKLALSEDPQNARLKQRLVWVTQNLGGKPAGPPPGRATDPQGELIDGSLRFLYAPKEVSDLRGEIKHYESRIGPAHDSRSAVEVYALGENYQVLSYLTSLRVVEVAPNSYRAHQLKARFYAEVGQFDEALKEYRAAEQLKPDLPELHFEIGDLYWGRDKLEEALPELQLELSIQPNHPQALYEVSDILIAEGKLNEAEQYVTRALRFDPGMIPAHLALERIYTATGRYSQSQAELESVFKLAPNNPRPHYRMALLLRKLGKHEEAQRELAIFASMQSKLGIKEVGSSVAGKESRP